MYKKKYSKQYIKIVKRVSKPNFPGLLGKKQIHLRGGFLLAGIRILTWKVWFRLKY